jgi:hypothetical protein
LSAELQAVVDALAAKGYEVHGIEHEGYANAKLGRPIYKIWVSKAVPKKN